jgi:hypothetical protein
MEVLQKIAADLESEIRVVQMYFGQTRYCAENYIFDTGLTRRGYGDGVTVAAKTCCDPKNMNFLDSGGPLSGSTVWNYAACHGQLPSS